MYKKSTTDKKINEMPSAFFKVNVSGKKILNFAPRANDNCVITKMKNSN